MGLCSCNSSWYHWKVFKMPSSKNVCHFTNMQSINHIYCWQIRTFLKYSALQVILFMIWHCLWSNAVIIGNFLKVKPLKSQKHILPIRNSMFSFLKLSIRMYSERLQLWRIFLSKNTLNLSQNTMKSKYVKHDSQNSKAGKIVLESWDKKYT